MKLSYETVRCWCDKFGKSYADTLRRNRRKPGDKWHLDEVFLKIKEAHISYGGRWISTTQ